MPGSSTKSTARPSGRSISSAFVSVGFAASAVRRWRTVSARTWLRRASSALVSPRNARAFSTARRNSPAVVTGPCVFWSTRASVPLNVHSGRHARTARAGSDCRSALGPAWRAGDRRSPLPTPEPAISKVALWICPSSASSGRTCAASVASAKASTPTRTIPCCLPTGRASGHIASPREAARSGEAGARSAPGEGRQGFKHGDGVRCARTLTRRRGRRRPLPLRGRGDTAAAAAEE